MKKSLLSILLLQSALSHASVHDWQTSPDATITSPESRCAIEPGMSTCTVSISYSSTEHACVFVKDEFNVKIAQCGTSGEFQASYIPKNGLEFELVPTSTGLPVAGTFVQAETSPSFMSESVQGVTLNALDGGNRYNIFSIMYRLAYGDEACNDVNGSTDNETVELLTSTLDLMAASGVTWIKIPLNYSQALNHTSTNYNDSGLTCSYTYDDVQGTMSPHMLQSLNTLLGLIKGYGFKVQLEFSGNSTLDDPLPNGQWVESVLTGVPAWAMDLISLSSGATSNDLEQVGFLYSQFKESSTPKFRHLNYTFTPAPLTDISNIEEIANIVRRYEMPVMPLAIGPVTPELAGPELLDAEDVANAYYALKMHQPIFINDVSYRWDIQNSSDQYDLYGPGSTYTASFESQEHFIDDFMDYYLDFSHSQQQTTFVRPLPVFFDGVGVSAYADDSYDPKYEIWENGSRSLFLEYSEDNELQTTPNWENIASGFSLFLNL